jgi:hypothetical protein
MPYVFKEPRHPTSWRQFRWRARNPLAVPFLFIEWLSEWAAWFLGRWVLLEVLEYCGTLSILVGVIFYFAGTRDRREQKHYQAWQVINTAQGKSGNGGRVDALQDLNADGIPLVAVDLSGNAFLRNINLPDADLHRADISGSDMRSAVLRRADLSDATLIYTNFRGTDLSSARLNDSDLTNADLSSAILVGADLSEAILDKADLRNADLSAIANWKSIKSIQMADIFGCRNAPVGFRDWAIANGAGEFATDDEWRFHIAATQPSR